MITLNCIVCDKSIQTYPSRIGRKKYCSPSCRGKSNPNVFKKGAPHLWIRGQNHPNWKGGRLKHIDGYIYIYSPNHPRKDIRGYVLEHRLTMEEFLKRYLLPNEVVHHKNAIKTDNRISNLQLFKSQAEHMRHESFIKSLKM